VPNPYYVINRAVYANLLSDVDGFHRTFAYELKQTCVMKIKSLVLFAVVAAMVATSCKKVEEVSDELIASFNPAQFEQNDCSMVDSLTSLNFVPSTQIYFSNESNQSLKIYWIQGNGNILLYKDDLKPGEGHNQQTFLTHPWYITTTDEECVTILTALNPAAKDTVHIQNL
jgi:hypothetical protein